MLQVKSKPLTLYLINFVPRSEQMYSDTKIYSHFIEFAIVGSITFKIGIFFFFLMMQVQVKFQLDLFRRRVCNDSLSVHERLAPRSSPKQE